MKVPVTKVEAFMGTAEDAGVLAHAWFDAEQKRIVATDGHRAVRLLIGIDECDTTGLVPREAFELARKELKIVAKINGKGSAPDPWVRVVCHDKAIEIENMLTNTKHIVVRPQLPDGKEYPNVDAVFPKVGAMPTCSVSRQYISDLASAMDGSAASINLWIDTEHQDEKPIVVAGGSGEAIALLMPMKKFAVDDIARRGLPR